jgi:hypothetical protein
MDLICKIRRLHCRKKKSEREISHITGPALNAVAKWLDGEVDGSPKYRRCEQPNKLRVCHEALKRALKADARRASANVARPTPAGLGERIRATGLRARRGAPVRPERRRRTGGGRHRLPHPGLAPEAVRQSAVLARCPPEPVPRDAVRCAHSFVRSFVRCARRRCASGHLQHEDHRKRGQERAWLLASTSTSPL